jgi:cell division protein FtsW
MSARVTSITHLRTAAKRREKVQGANSRLAASLLVIVGILTVIGLGATLSASSVAGLLSEANDNLVFFKRQVFWVGAGAVVMFIAMKVPYTLYRRIAAPILLISIFGLVLVELFGVSDGGAKSWLAIGPVSGQPSEFAKFGVIVFLAATLSRKAKLLEGFWHFLAPVAASAGIVMLLVLKQRDLGTTLVIAAAAAGVLLASAAPLLYVLATGVVGGGLATAAALAEPYRRARILCFLHPEADPLGNCFQLTQSQLALGSGGLFGVGLGASRARWSYLPNAHTDFIYAIMGEETGFAGAVMILLMFVMLTLLGVAISHRSSDPFGRLLAAGITAWLSAQAIINIGGVVGVVPITGIPLPFVSVGGTAMVTAMGAVGVLINIAQNSSGKKARA